MPGVADMPGVRPPLRTRGTEPRPSWRCTKSTPRKRPCFHRWTPGGHRPAVKAGGAAGGAPRPTCVAGVCGVHGGNASAQSPPGAPAIWLPPCTDSEPGLTARSEGSMPAAHLLSKPCVSLSERPSRRAPGPGASGDGAVGAGGGRAHLGGPRARAPLPGGPGWSAPTRSWFDPAWGSERFTGTHGKTRELTRRDTRDTRESPHSRFGGRGSQTRQLRSHATWGPGLRGGPSACHSSAAVLGWDTWGRSRRVSTPCPTASRGPRSAGLAGHSGRAGPPRRME